MRVEGHTITTERVAPDLSDFAITTEIGVHRKPLTLATYWIQVIQHPALPRSVLQ